MGVFVNDAPASRVTFVDRMSRSPEHNPACFEHFKEQLTQGVEGRMLVDVNRHCDQQECTVGLVCLTYHHLLV